MKALKVSIVASLAFLGSFGLFYQSDAACDGIYTDPQGNLYVLSEHVGAGACSGCGSYVVRVPPQT